VYIVVLNIILLYTPVGAGTNLVKSTHSLALELPLSGAAPTVGRVNVIKNLQQNHCCTIYKILAVITASFAW